MKRLFTIFLTMVFVLSFTTSVISGERFKVGGYFTAKCYTKEGVLKWETRTHNMCFDTGINALLDIMFHGTTQITTWYIGLIDNGSSLAAGDTLASHAGWTENTEYGTPATRGEWTEGAASSKSMTNSSSVDFTMNDSGTLDGAFLCSAASGTSGTLFAGAAFTGGDRTYESTNVIKITYTISGADS